jgi:hypothetical protein
MTEGIKTLIYAGVAVVVSLAAFVSRPKVDEFEVQEIVGQVLFEKFDDPAKAASMEIVQYDEELGTIQTFKVARDKGSGAWTIPSHGGYPADAEDRMRDASLLLIDLQVLGVASEEAGDHNMFGVVEPDKDKLKVGDEGVGLLVSFEDRKDQDLASLIIGKKVKGEENQRFVRIPGQDIVYAVQIDPDKLSTEFEDWIDQDLLQMNAWDVRNATLKNYTVSQQSLTSVSLDRQFDLSASYVDAKWQLDSLTEYQNGQPQEVEPPADKELDGDNLNDLKNAVDGLEIIDVQRKPKGLGADLKAGEGFAKNEEGLADLNRRGFYVVPAREGGYDVLSANGDVYVGMEDGTEYVLRFGNTLAGTGGDAEQGDSRYLFVMARVDMSKFPPPELEVVPELPEDSEAGDNEAEENGAEAAEGDSSNAAEGATAEEQAEGEKAETDEAAGDDREAREAEIAKERERIIKENQRKLDERNEKLEKAREKAADLNIRFADWYYVVSEEQFDKVQLDRDELFKQKQSDDQDDTAGGEMPAADDASGDEPPTPSDDIESFRKLQEDGLSEDEE